uniref:Uncharacterized protein n=1 Tax=Gouania willdenowi TaxID=441366 RepID=A0A8C5EF49_GOUWI
MSSREMEEYLNHHQISHIMEVRLALLHHRPEDPLSFLQSCLIRAHPTGHPGSGPPDSPDPPASGPGHLGSGPPDSPDPPASGHLGSGPPDSPDRPVPGHPGPGPLLHSQISIDSDSELTESYGLQQEVGIHLTRQPFIIFDDLVVELRRQLIDQQDVFGFLFDGFPLDVHQALSFQEQIGCPDLVVLLCSSQRASIHRHMDMDMVSLRRYYQHLSLLTEAEKVESAIFWSETAGRDERPPITPYTLVLPSHGLRQGFIKGKKLLSFALTRLR